MFRRTDEEFGFGLVEPEIKPFQTYIEKAAEHMGPECSQVVWGIYIYIYVHKVIEVVGLGELIWGKFVENTVEEQDRQNTNI